MSEAKAGFGTGTGFGFAVGNGDATTESGAVTAVHVPPCPLLRSPKTGPDPRKRTRSRSRTRLFRSQHLARPYTSSAGFTPHCLASNASWVRFSDPSFWYSRHMWAFTVRSLICSSVAIFRLSAPAAT